MKLTVDKTRLIEAIKAAIANKEAAATAKRAKAKQLPALKRQLAQVRKQRAVAQKALSKAGGKYNDLSDKIYNLGACERHRADTSKEKSILRRLEMVVGDTLEVSDQDDYFKYI